MKKFLAITTSLIATFGALALGGSAVAFAGTDETGGSASSAGSYPDTFETSPKFGSLDDYAVGNGEYLFLEKNVMYKYGSGDVVPYEGSRKTITHLYFESGEFYYETKDGKLYALTNFNEEDKFEDFTLETPSSVELGTYYYFKNNDAYYFIDQNADEPRSLLEVDNVKKYGNDDDGYEVYAVRTTEESKQVLCTLTGKDHSDVEVKDFDLVKNIAVGDAYASLTNAAEEIRFVDLTAGAYMTEVSLGKLTDKSSTYFSAADKPVTVTVPADTPTALLLYTDNLGISIVAVNGKSYLIHPDNANLNNVYPPKNLENAKGTATAGYIYSSPFESAGTRIKNSSGENDLIVLGEVKILQEIRKEKYPVLDGDFYYVEYEPDEKTTVKGYVRLGLISTYTFNEADPQETPDPDATYEDLIKPVVLILIVLLLIAIAAGYLIYVGTSDKRKKKNEVAATDEKERDER